MRFQFVRTIRKTFEIIPIRQIISKEDMHHSAGEGAVTSRFQTKGKIGLLHGRILIDVDDNNFGAPLFAGTHGMGHDIDLGRDRIGSPNHHTIGFCHFARIRSGQ